MSVTILSYSAGQDSHTILTKLIEDPQFRARYAPNELIVIMSDTGNEHPHTYETAAFAEMYCEDNRIPFFLLGDEYKTTSWQGGLLGQWANGIPTVGSKAYPKTCTDKCKVQPIYKKVAELLESRGYGKAFRKRSMYGYAEQHGKLNVLIGITSEESNRVADPTNNPNKWFSRNVQTVYPLVELGYARLDCQSYLQSMESITGIPCPFPSNCMFCPFNQEFDLVWLDRNIPDQFELWCEFESAKLKGDIDQRQIASDKSLGVWGKPDLTLRDVLAKAELTYGHMTDDELNQYKFSHGHCVASAY